MIPKYIYSIKLSKGLNEVTSVFCSTFSYFVVKKWTKKWMNILFISSLI